MFRSPTYPRMNSHSYLNVSNFIDKSPLHEDIARRKVKRKSENSQRRNAKYY